MLINWFRALTLLALVSSIIIGPVEAQRVEYRNGWGPAGLSVKDVEDDKINMVFSVSHFEISQVSSGDALYEQVSLPGSFLFNQPGAPNLPVISKYIAIPEGSSPKFSVRSFQKETIEDLSLAPAPVIPVDIDDQEPGMLKDPSIYGQDEFYPAEPFFISEKRKIRGVDVVVLVIMPFQYNPISKEMVIYKDIEMTLELGTTSNHYGNDRYRNRWWDDILSDMLVNFDQVPGIDYSKKATQTQSRTFAGCDYLIITPNGAAFQQWGDSLKAFRTEQGILTETVTLSEIGGTTSADIEAYIDNAYNTWDIPPAAILLLGDHGTDPVTTVPSKIMNDHPAGYNPYVTDNYYADVDGDLLPDIAIARMVARDAAELEMMVHKVLDYEKNPPVNPGFYDNPITALGWQTERWFQICSETIGGFWSNVLGKSPVRINEIYAGDPTVDPWSTAPNTSMVLDYFGPDGMGYIPASPTALGNWSGGTASDINTAINNGAFMVQHRDHGYTFGWGEPSYSTNNVSGLTNTDLSFILSINCQTGRFDYGSECLAEKFYRRQSNGTGMGALGLIAPTETSFSFVNDTYVWGFYDHLWPEFMPDNNAEMGQRDMLPCFANASAKYFLEQSNWPYNSSSKNITYNLFHHHGDAFLTLYSEVPQALTVAHESSLPSSLPTFAVTADEGAMIALTCDGEILGVEESAGLPVVFNFDQPLSQGQTMVVTVTLRNHLRYRAEVPVVNPQGPYVIFDTLILHDGSYDNDGILDYGESVYADLVMSNIGNSAGQNVNVKITPMDDFSTLSDSTEYFGTIPAGNVLQKNSSIHIELSPSTPYPHEVVLKVEAWNSEDTWTSYAILPTHAPRMLLREYTVDDASGNGNGKLDPGETAMLNVKVANEGSSSVTNPMAYLTTVNPNVQINTNYLSFGNIVPGDSVTCTFQLTALPELTHGDSLHFDFHLSADLGLAISAPVKLMIGKIPVLVIDLDPSANSGPVIKQTAETHGLVVEYMTAFPASFDDYLSVFVCLGVYPYNTQLSTSQGLSLASFLNSGGKLYMEGADTWFYDPQTAVHPMFYVDPVSDGSSDLGTIVGETGTVMEGISVNYSGENQWIDQIDALGTAELVLKNQSPEYGTVVFNDTLGYQTIAASHEFNGLADASGSEVTIMAEYLKFFGIPLKADWLGISSDWNDPQNWSNQLIPDPMTHVTIPTMPARGGGYPTDNSGDIFHCKSLKLEQGAMFQLPTGKTLYIYN